jgi:tellurite resistance protein TerC
VGLRSQYFAGWVVEKSLSIDNLFVFAIIMTTFAVPAEHQHKVLTFGIIAALLLRVIFIVIGAALLAAFSFMFLLFGLLLIVTAVQLFRHRDEDPSIEDNAIVRFARRRLPFIERYDGAGCSRATARAASRRRATGLAVILAFIGVELVLHFAHLQEDTIPDIVTATSLGVIVAVLIITTRASVLRPVATRPHTRTPGPYAPTHISR